MMTFQPVFEAGEQVSADISFSHKPVRRLMLTNRAAYWSGSKFHGFGSTTKRVPLSQVVSVVIREEWHQGRLIGGFIMLISGVIGFVLVIGGFVNAQGHDKAFAVVIPLLLSAIGALLVAGGGRRRTLIIAADGIEFSWGEPHTFGNGPSPSMFDQARIWAQRNGLPLDESGPNRSPMSRAD